MSWKRCPICNELFFDRFNLGRIYCSKSCLAKSYNQRIRLRFINNDKLIKLRL